MKAKPGKPFFSFNVPFTSPFQSGNQWYEVDLLTAAGGCPVSIPHFEDEWMTRSVSGRASPQTWMWETMAPAVWATQLLRLPCFASEVLAPSSFLTDIHSFPTLLQLTLAFPSYSFSHESLLWSTPSPLEKGRDYQAHWPQPLASGLLLQRTTSCVCGADVQGINHSAQPSAGRLSSIHSWAKAWQKHQEDESVELISLVNPKNFSMLLCRLCLLCCGMW